MRVCVFAAVLLLSACGTATASPQEANALIADFDTQIQRGERIVAEIGAMHARDRLLREIIIRGFRTQMSGKDRQAYIDGTRHHFDRIDGENTRRLREILREISWEELSALSPGAADQVHVMISHSNDIEFKHEMAATLEPLARSGRVPGERYANLIDDIALMEERPQIYGTNFECRDGVYQPKQTEAPEALNARRAEIGLESIEAYTARMREMYGQCPADYSGN